MYKPAGNVQDPATADEFLRIAQAFEELIARKLEVTYVAPLRPTRGDILIADGTSWDPAALAVMSPLWFNGSTWVAMGAGGGGGVTDHGALTGLADDDHPQYHNDARGDARYSVLAHNHSGAYEPLGSRSRDSMMYFLSSR